MGTINTHKKPKLLFFNAKNNFMLKTELLDRVPRSRTLLKTLLVMKLIALFILATTLNVSANPVMGQNVNLNLKQTEIRKVLKQIEIGTDYRFLFNSKLKALKNKVDFNASNLSLSES